MINFIALVMILMIYHNLLTNPVKMVLQEILQEKCFFLAFLQDLVEYCRNLVTRFLLDSCKTQMSQDLAQVQEKDLFLEDVTILAIFL